MKIDLKVPGALSHESVAALLASKNDDEHRQVRVTKDGIAYLSDVVGAEGTDDLAFYLETFAAGNDYVGEAAARDEEHVDYVFQSLKNNWPNVVRGRYVD